MWLARNYCVINPPNWSNELELERKKHQFHQVENSPKIFINIYVENSPKTRLLGGSTIRVIQLSHWVLPCIYLSSSHSYFHHWACGVMFHLIINNQKQQQQQQGKYFFSASWRVKCMFDTCIDISMLLFVQRNCF